MRIFRWIVPVLMLMASCHAQEITGSNAGNYSDGTSKNGKTPQKDEKKTNVGPTSMSEETFNKLVTMEATAQNTEGALVISYEVENHSDQTLYLWDGMIGWNSQGQFLDPDSAYVFFQEPKTVRVIRAPLPLPQLRNIGRKEIPFARILGPRSKLTGKITLKHPVGEYSPYYEPMTPEDQSTAKCSEVRLMIGWTQSRPGMRIEERTVGGAKAIAIRGGWEPPYQEILEEIIPVQVELAIYTSTFERQLPLK